MIWAILCGWALWHVILPGGVAFITCGVARQVRVGKLQAGLLTAAQASLEAAEPGR